MRSRVENSFQKDVKVAEIRPINRKTRNGTGEAEGSRIPRYS